MANRLNDRLMPVLTFARPWAKLRRAYILYYSSMYLKRLNVALLDIMLITPKLSYNLRLWRSLIFLHFYVNPSSESYYVAKVGSLGHIASTAALCDRKINGNLPQIMLIWAFHEFFRLIACRCVLYGLPLPCFVKELNDDGHTRCLKKKSGDQNFRNVKESNKSG